MSVITIIGAGMMGSAVSFPAADNGNEIRLVGTPLDREIIEHAQKDGYHITLKRRLPDGVKCFQAEDMDKALEGCDLLVGGVSSFGVDWFGENVLPRIPRNLPVLSVTKGLYATAEGRLIAFPDYLASKQGCEGLSLNAIGGPCTSYELADRHQTIVAFCGHNIGILAKIKAMLSTEYYHISLTEDVIGLETAVAMKNAYALGVSLAIGLAESRHGEGCPEEYNPQAALFAQGMREMRRMLELVGGDESEIIYGAGDLYVTVFGGRTRKIGTLLGRGMSFAEARERLSGITLESIEVTRTVVEALLHSGNDMSSFPLLRHIYSLINDGAAVNVPWLEFEEPAV